ncbi:hypothetical protein [Campylobacter lanienae]|uniref:hypothetical protein n=1 Tax=Campylobacter lanienae TaxID=75658 RepID=UPI00243254C9|nr:hypothetical protein [Campylobacter lanienae]
MDRYEIWLFVGLNLAFCVAFLGLGGEFLWVVFLGAVVELVLCRWHLDTRAEFSGEIWQRNLAMVKKKPLIVVAITGGHRPEFSGGWLLLGGGLKMDYKFI